MAEIDAHVIVDLMNNLNNGDFEGIIIVYKGSRRPDIIILN
jgi:hypothetical protein